MSPASRHSRCFWQALSLQAALLLFGSVFALFAAAPPATVRPGMRS